jgi:hypothetical protein
LETEHSEELAETIQPFLQKALYYFDRRITTRDSGTPGRDDHLQILPRQPFGKHSADLCSFISNPLPRDDFVSRLLQTGGDGVTAAVIVSASTVTHSQNSTAGYLARGGSAVTVGGLAHVGTSHRINGRLRVCYDPAP